MRTGPPSTAPAIEADVVVVGTGIAGLTFALEMARGASVLLLTKKSRAESNTNWARGGIAAVVGPDDAPEFHVRDTLVAGAGLCHGDVVRRTVAEGPARIADLSARGTLFHREAGGLSLGREGGHSHRRIVHAGDRTGRAIESALLDRAGDCGLAILEDHRVEALHLSDGAGARGEPGVRGVSVVDDARGLRRLVRARAVLLATGGAGRVYQHTTNPGIATGDGVAMAFRAGARIANMEFVQFHPTALHPTEDPAFLISEALRGEGAVLEGLDGTRFMDRYDARGSLAPRDIVARAIARELRRTGEDHVRLDISAIDGALRQTRFASTLDGCRERGLRPDTEGIPVVPAAHYICGGIWTDDRGRSSIDGLLAAGEVACTGLHGANRLASNSLLEAVVMAHRSAEGLRAVLEAEGRWREHPRPPVLPDHESHAATETALPDPDDDDAVREVRRLMWEKAGIVRSVAGLREADEALVGWGTQAGPASAELSSLVTTAHLIVRCALARRESRGLHWLEDHPWRNNERCLRDTVVTRGPAGLAVIEGCEP